ncbi:Mur ligase family protein [Microbacterium nanhaiense]|nr:Mur ligase family protein [Microbacterium nanhaiense]
MTSRLDSLDSWNADWAGLKVAVLGLGSAGFAAADTLAELGAQVLVVTEQAADEYARLLSVIGAQLIETDRDRVAPTVDGFAPDVIVASPGFAPSHPAVRWALESGVALWGDVELAWRVRDKVARPDGSPAEWILVTGTVGKTTTAELASLMLVEAGLRAAPCGANGIPVLDAVRDPAGFDALVLELSSAQLWYLGLSAGAGAPQPIASVCLNLGETALGWHESAAHYRDAMAVVYRFTRIACVYNKRDDATMRMVEEADVIEGARAVGVDLGVPGPSDLGIVDGILADRAFVENRHTSAAELTTLEHLAGLGLAVPEIVADVLFAAALARSMGAEPASIHRALGSVEYGRRREVAAEREENADGDEGSAEA